MKYLTAKPAVSFKLLPLVLCSLLYGCSGGAGSDTSASDENTSGVSSIDETDTTTDTTTETTTDTTTETTTETTTDTTTDTTTETTTDTTTETITDTTTETITDTTTETTTETITDTETPTEPEPEPEPDNAISVLFVYSAEFSELYGEDTDLRLQQLINTANQSFQDSALSVEFTVAGAVEVEFDPLKSDNDALTAITCDIDILGRSEGCVRGDEFTFVSALRDETKADIISFVRPYHSSRQNQCGLGWVSGSGYDGDLSHPFWKEITVNVVSVDGPCTEWTFTHELGHNLGLNHGAMQDTTGGTFPWAWGYGEYNNFSTIMTYRHLYGENAQSIYRFSNPDQICNDTMCGITKNESNGADAVDALRITIPQVAAYQLSQNDIAINNPEPLTSEKAEIIVDAELIMLNMNH